MKTAETARNPASWALLALGVAAATALWTTEPPVTHRTWAFVFLWGYFLAWICYLAASIITTRAPGLPRWILLWIVVVAISLRLICLVRTPALSSDLWRYLWDGRAANAGINPYLYPPDAPEVRHLRDGNWQPINHKPIPTIYPPLAQMLFRALALVRDRDAQAFRWAFALFDVGSVLLLMALVGRTGRPPERAIWYAWCPLPATEVTAGSHGDAFGLFLLLLALLLAARSSPRAGPASGLALAGAVMAKGYPLLALPFFVRRGGWRVLLPFAAACLALLAPYLGARRHLFTGLRIYLGTCETNSGVFVLINQLLADFTPRHFIVTRHLMAVAVLAIVVCLTWRQKPTAEWLLGATFAALGAQLLISAPTFPWYVIWIVPVLCWWTIPGLVLFTLTVSAQYYARWLFPGDQAAHYRLLWAGYLPVYALLIAQVVWWRVAGAATTAAARR